jgi:hypothetical protein
MGGEPLPPHRAYIEAYRSFAIAEQQRTGIPAAVTMAQALHESGSGMGDLATRSNNHFGIKCKSNWAGPKVFHDDDARGECFRAYASVYESYRDHSDFLKQNARYRFLFDYPLDDYKAWANGLKKAGYATNPRYADLLIKTIEDNGLQTLTLLAQQPGVADSAALSAMPTQFQMDVAAGPAGLSLAEPTYAAGMLQPVESNKPTADAVTTAAPSPSNGWQILEINGCKAVQLPVCWA